MKKHTIIGTAGHIDHGKTALIRALTGIDADRLKEEKERGITIDIGFAYWRDEVTILDVPGHEKFIRNMVAGVNTIDFFLLVIAADDGIMPQTVEHLDILNFFNIRNGIIVINKIDLVDAEWLALVEDDIENMLRSYHLQDLPRVKVSAVSGKNIDTLREIIEQKINALEENTSIRPFRLLVDRSFVVKGFGTVVTGTVISDQLNKGDDIEILPSGLNKKVRGLQAHGHESDEVRAGDRAAVNLQGITKIEITRGDVLTKPGTLCAVNEFIGTLRSVRHLPVKIVNRARVRVYSGTAERIGQMIWYETNKLMEPAQDYHVRIKLETPFAAARGDAFLVRLNSPIVTLAGGVILEINPPKIPHKTEVWKDYFELIQSADETMVLQTLIYHQQLRPVSALILQQKMFTNPENVRASLDTLQKQKKIRKISIKGADHFLSEIHFETLLKQIESTLDNFHKKSPHLPGLNAREIVSWSGYKWVSAEVFEAALKKLLNSGRVKSEKNIYSIFAFSLRVSKDIETVKQDILTCLTAQQFSPEPPDQLAARMDMPVSEIQSILKLLVNEGQIFHIHQDFYLHQSAWNDLLQFLRTYFSDHDQLPVADLKDYINTTRKYAIPLFEFLDAEEITLRSGDFRKKGHRL